MPLFSTLQSLAVFWHLVSPRLPTCSFAYLLVDYHTCFVLKFSLVFLIRRPADVSSPFQSSEFSICHHNCILVCTIDAIIIASIFLYLPTHSSDYFPFKGSKLHFRLLGHNASFNFPPSTILRTEAASNFEMSINFY